MTRIVTKVTVMLYAVYADIRRNVTYNMYNTAYFIYKKDFLEGIVVYLKDPQSLLQIVLPYSNS